MEKRVAFAQRLRSFLDDCVSASSTEITTIEAINDAWQSYCDSKDEVWWRLDCGMTDPPNGQIPVVNKVPLMRPDALERMLTRYYKYEYVESGPHRIPSWKCKITPPSE